MYLQRSAGGVVGVGLYFDGLLEHDPEGGVGPIRQKGVLVRTQDSVGSRLLR